MFFLKISNADILFGKKIFTWKFYTINKALLITKQVQIVNLEKYVIAELDVNSETFLMHVTIWEQEKIPVHSKKQAQVGTLLFDEAFTEVLAECSNYNNVFLAENIAEFLEKTRMNEHIIKLEKGK